MSSPGKALSQSMYLIKYGRRRQTVKCFYLTVVGTRFSGTIDMNFSGLLGERKFIEVIGSGLWSKRAEGNSDLRKRIKILRMSEATGISDSLGTS